MIVSLKRAALACTLIFTFSILSAQQVISLQYRAVPQENIDEFLHRETTYWSKVAKKAIAEGKMQNWQLWERIGGWNMDEDTPNYVFVNVFSDVKAFDNINSIWGSVSKIFPNGRMSDMETNSLAKVVNSIILQGQGVIGTSGKYAAVNYLKADDVSALVDFETKTWLPFITEAIHQQKCSFVGWSVATLISPQGAALPWNAMTVDHFNSMSEALIPNWDDSLTFPDLEEYEKTIKRQYRGIYRLVDQAVSN